MFFICIGTKAERFAMYIQCTCLVETIALLKKYCRRSRRALGTPTGDFVSVI